MLDATGKKLLGLLQPGRPNETRRAAALVLAEVGARDGEVAHALQGALDDADPALRLGVVNALGKLHVEQALPRLLELVVAGGPLGEVAALAAARLGVKGTRALQNLMSKVAPGLRRRIAAALAAAGTPSAGSLALDALLDSDPGVVDAAARSLTAEVPSLTETHRHTLADHLLELLRDSRRAGLPLSTETALLRLLAALGDARAEPVFWERAQPSRAPEVRAAALQALGKWVHAPSRDRLKQLFACAADTDFCVAAPALMILQTLPASAKVMTEWLLLLDAPDVAVRRAALEKVGTVDKPEVATALLRQLSHPDRSLREAALSCLTRLDEGRKGLAAALLQAKSSDEAWLLARAQAPFVREYKASLRDQVFKQACVYLDAGDRRADALLFVLREADGPGLRDRLEERALALRKKKLYAQALLYFRLLTRDPACGAAVRLEQAACGLKVSAHDLSADARLADASLEQFARLVSSHEDELHRFVDRARWLEPADLFYLGFHFAERDRRDKEFGGKVLRLLIKRSPRSKLAKDAKNKLKREGFDV